MIVHGEGGLVDLEEIKNDLGEMPNIKKERIMKDYSLSGIKAILFVLNPNVFEYFEKTVLEIKKILKNEDLILKSHELTYNYLATDILGYISLKNIDFNKISISPVNFAKLINLIVEDKISSRGAKIILEKIIEEDNDPEIVMKEEGLEQVSNDEELRKFVLDVLEENVKSVQEYMAGKVTVLQFLIGKAMAKAKGAGNPAKIKEIIEKELNK